ncbi:5-oxoprolinase subunit PpxA [Bacillus carboniphilus]|uniref:5-oxoprolinase subunit A n=1 Tax=Bacillus carboniphilus TaxID=86663 RepID=A0ABP3G1I2_9BACI
MIDINCDLGESYGVYKLGQDSFMMPEVTSVNIACGFHAGDPQIISETIEMAIHHNLRIGAHPGFPDLQGFGRRNMVMTPNEIYNMVLYQIGAFSAFLKVHDYPLHHVKPHGALYNMAAVNEEYAAPIVRAIADFDSSIKLYALSGSILATVAERAGLPVFHEVFADRTYQNDGTLTPRSCKNALIKDDQQAIQQVVNLVESGKVLSVDGKWIPLKADTVCIHGDGEHALMFAQKLRKQLVKKEG